MIPAFLVVDKPRGLTSHDVVAMVRAVTGIKKVGHTGTLDPLASGVLPLALGGATRFIQFLDEQLKVYDATVQLGARTSTGDREGEVVERRPVPPLEGLEATLEGFVGERMQVPPAYSAVKVGGKPLYKYAREGRAVAVAARPITIYGMELIEAGEDWLRVLIRCSRGTYARVLAEEIGEALGSAGHLSALRRRRSGPFTLERALGMPELGQIAAGTEDWERALRRPAPGQERVKWRRREEVHAGLAPKLITLSEALAHLPAAELRPAERRRVLSGGRPPAPPPGLTPGGRYRVLCAGELLAVAEAGPGGGRLLRAIRGR